MTSIQGPHSNSDDAFDRLEKNLVDLILLGARSSMERFGSETGAISRSFREVGQGYKFDLLQEQAKLYSYWFVTGSPRGGVYSEHHMEHDWVRALIDCLCEVCKLHTSMQIHDEGGS